MLRATLAFFALFSLSILTTISIAEAQQAYVHIVRNGETLAGIAETYYGDVQRERVLVAVNGLQLEGGQKIVPGMRILIPTVQYHVVKERETWAKIADQYYGDSKRAFAISEANRGATAPDVGAEVLIPYPLPYNARQGELIRRISHRFYKEKKSASRRLRRFNNLRGLRTKKAVLLLIPLSDLVLSEGGKERIAKLMPQAADGGDMRAHQEEIEAELPAVSEAVSRGHYVKAVGLANRLLGRSDLTERQRVEIYKALAETYVALNSDDLATAVFVDALRLSPGLQLDSLTTSPRVMQVFSKASAYVRAGN